MEMTPDATAIAVACRQAGALSRKQASAVGLSDGQIARRLARGTWVRRHPGVYAMAASPPTWRQDLWAAHLAVGRGTVSHETAVLVHGVGDRHLPRYPLTFTVSHGDHHWIPGSFVHQIDDVLPHHVCERDRLPVSTPARAVVDLAAVVGRRHLGDIVDAATDRLTTISRISVCAAEIARPGKRGLGKLGAVLDERGPGHVPPQSELEGRLFEVLAHAGLPAPVRQFPLPGRGVVTGLADAAYPDVRLILEADGRRWHSRIAICVATICGTRRRRAPVGKPCGSSTRRSSATPAT